MPKKNPKDIKKPIYIRLSPESLSYVKRLAEETCRDVTNVIEYLIFLHSKGELKEPIPYFNKPVKKTHDSYGHDKESQDQRDKEDLLIDRQENPYAKDD